MNLDEIEENYTSKKRILEESFTQGMKDKKNTVELEKIYRLKIKKLREEYYKNMSELISKSKSTLINKKNNKKKQKKSQNKKNKNFKVVPAKFELSLLDKIKIKKSLAYLKFHIKFHKSYDKFYYPHLSYLYIKIRNQTWRTIKELKNIIEKISLFLFKILLDILKGIRNFFLFVIKKFVKFARSFFKTIFKIFRRKKEKEKKTDKES